MTIALHVHNVQTIHKSKYKYKYIYHIIFFSTLGALFWVLFQCNLCRLLLKQCAYFINFHLVHYPVTFPYTILLSPPICLSSLSHLLDPHSFKPPYLGPICPTNPFVGCLYTILDLVLICFSVSVFTVRRFSAKRGLAIACHLPVRDVSGLWWHRLEFFRNNFTVS